MNPSTHSTHAQHHRLTLFIDGGINCRDWIPFYMITSARKASRKLWHLSFINCSNQFAHGVSRPRTISTCGALLPFPHKFQSVAMKRSVPSANIRSVRASKRPRVEVPEYHLTPSLRDPSGEAIWPAPKDQLELARNIIREWYVLEPQRECGLLFLIQGVVPPQGRRH